MADYFESIIRVLAGRILQLTFDDSLGSRHFPVSGRHREASWNLTTKEKEPDGCLFLRYFRIIYRNDTDENFQDGVHNKSFAYGEASAHQYAQPCQRPGYSI